MSVQEVALAVAGLGAVVAALLAATGRKVVHAALWLVVTLGLLAVAYLLLGAEMVALTQVLVYVGAVVVLVLFALMLTRAPIAARADLDAAPRRRGAAALLGGATAALVAGVLLPAVGDRTVDVDETLGSARSLGRVIFGAWLLPFEVISVLLLAALVAALAVSRARPDADGGR
ncbi:MAG: NADH-quinone oxidoreductase subunit J [Kineosporiaceae bacterium]